MNRVLGIAVLLAIVFAVGAGQNTTMSTNYGYNTTIGYGCAGNYGTSGQVLTSGGTGAACSWGQVSLPLQYSAAGTPLPTCNAALKAATAIVLDATAPTYMGAYASGGGITAAVICSYNGTTYSWLTH